MRYRTAALALGGLLLAVWLAPWGWAQEINPSVRLDGAPLKLDVPAVLDEASGRTLVPVRQLAELLGYTVTWDAQTQMVTAERPGSMAEFRIGYREAVTDGARVNLDVAPRLVRGRALVPLRFFAEFAGAAVSWDEATKSVDITSSTSQADRPDTSWAHPQGGIRHTRYNDGATFGAAVTPMWEKTFPEQGYSSFPDSPVTAGDGLVFFTLGGASFGALNRETGEPVWQAQIASAINPVYDAARNLVYVMSGEYDGKLYALNASDGSQQWFAALGGGWNRTQPLLLGSQVIVRVSSSSDRNRLTAFDASTGSKLWTADVAGSGIPSAFGARIFIADDSGGVHAYRAMDGSPLWHWTSTPAERNYNEQYEVVVAAGRVYHARNQKAIALDEATGQLVWERNDLDQAGSIATDGNKLWVSVKDGITVLDAATGEKLRYPAICIKGPSAPVLSRSHAFVACDGSIYAIDRESYAVTRIGSGEGPLSLDGDRLYYNHNIHSYQQTVGALMAVPR